MIVVSDTTPLISLLKINRIENQPYRFAGKAVWRCSDSAGSI